MDILDIDEVLKDDSFCNLSADRMDDSITGILQQWKQNEMTLVGTKGTKLVDTRTFTRPKKRGGFGENDQEPSTPIGSGINLQVGGLVTSMRRSLIGETSPPSSFCSSVDSMHDEMLNSLITSGDFNNVSFFMENLEDSPNINFNGYKLEDVIRDRKFLDNLTLSEDQTFSKDASILRTDDMVISGDSSDSNPLINVTMKLNPEFEGTFLGKDNTFNISTGGNDVPRGSETFNLMGDTTIVMPTKEEVNATYDCDSGKKNMTFTCEEIPAKVDVPEKKTPESGWCYQSTPMKSSVKKEIQRRCNLSPIKCDPSISSPFSGSLSKEGNFEKYLQEATDQAFTPDKLMKKSPFQSPEKEIEVEDDNEVVERRRLPIPIHMLRDDERQSLKNFEEYEKTLLMQDTTTDRDFDDVLNRFGTMSIRQNNEKMRQSLDSIKKRHSLVNLEKQQQEEMSRAMDNKLSDSLSKSRRLLSRRSRIYDELHENPPPEKVEPPEPAVEKVSPTKNRDRFKTIRIIRPLEENPPSLPDAGDTTVDIDPPPPPPEFKKPTIPVRNIPKPRYFKSALVKPICQQKFSSADDLLDSEEADVDKTQSLKSPMGIKSKSIHNLLSGQRSLASMEKLTNQCDYKSSSETINKTHPNSKLSLAPSSRFGKSNQSLDRLTSASRQPQSQSSDSDRYKIDTRNHLGNNQSNLAKMRCQPKRPGLVRPSSGYYSYSVRRNDSDTESGRYSPQSLSSSSASSKGSINVPEVPSTIQDTTFDSHKTYSSLQPDATKLPASVLSKVPRPTGLRLPSNFRAGASSALPRATGIPRR
ncbi:hypothetical protein DMENIID0001_041070 [Sergentomyia squamirostris]